MLSFLRFIWLLPLLGPAAPSAFAGPALREIAPPVQDYEPRPALWLLEDEDTKIYLFGTFHILPPGFKWRSPALERAIAAADELVVETSDDPETADELQSFAMVRLDEPAPVLERVPEARRAQLQAAIEASGLPMEFFDSMRTWVVGMMLGMAQLLGSYGAADPADAPGVEGALERLFREAGKPILSVEDGNVVFASLNRLPEPAQVDLLLNGLDDLEAAEARAGKEDRHWAKGEVEALALDDPETFPPLLFDLLLRKRNAAWTEWLARRLEKPGTVLFAVGAAHLAGRESVQAMLAERGFGVTRVN